MQDLLDAYLEHLRSERQLSSHTLIGYRQDLSTLLTFCTQEQIDSWSALDTPRLRRLIGRLHKQG
ncbi:MAG: tyrosine recombinase XerC, partial [Pseudomonas sp.]|nr:tyrosine recombinase XerC [Pseudomonas sp.]